MYTVKTIKEVLENPGYDNYRLCYMDEISKTVYRYDKDFEFLGEFDNPEYIKGEQEVYAFFTPLSLNEQWGDDWNDIPVEHNAGYPYDHGKNFNKKVEILMIPFQADGSYFPWSYGLNSTFSAETINLGAIPWLFLRDENNNSEIINSGISPRMFCNLITKWRLKK